jgi:hypothetical protein
MIYEYILLDEEKIARENPSLVISELYKKIEDNGKRFNLKRSTETYDETGKGIMLETDGSDEEYKNSMIFYMTLTLDSQVMKYVEKWSLIHNLDDDGDVFIEEDVLEVRREVK